MKLKVTRIEVDSAYSEGRSCTFGFVSDLHNGPYQDALAAVSGVDAILVAGDMLDRHHPGMENASGFLKAAPEVAPVYLSLGNHEVRSDEWPAFRKLIEASSAVLLDDEVTVFKGIVLGGLTSREKERHRLEEDEIPSIVRFVETMASMKGFKLLLCHHPEYYERCIRGHGIDLTLSGHAHGGQVQLFRHGLYAPGQGLFPRYTDGFYDDGHLLVNRGMTNSTWAPRLWNPCEVILLTVRY